MLSFCPEYSQHAHLSLQHVELGQMPSGVRVLSTEGGAQHIGIAKSTGAPKFQFE